MRRRVTPLDRAPSVIPLQQASMITRMCRGGRRATSLSQPSRRTQLATLPPGASASTGHNHRFQSRRQPTCQYVRWSDSVRRWPQHRATWNARSWATQLRPLRHRDHWARCLVDGLIGKCSSFQDLTTRTRRSHTYGAMRHQPGRGRATPPDGAVTDCMLVGSPPTCIRC